MSAEDDFQKLEYNCISMITLACLIFGGNYIEYITCYLVQDE